MLILKNLIKSFISDEGATLIEYLILLGIFLVATIASVLMSGGALQDAWLGWAEFFGIELSPPV